MDQEMVEKKLSKKELIVSWVDRIFEYQIVDNIAFGAMIIWEPEDKFLGIVLFKVSIAIGWMSR